ncbi:putative EMP1-like protein, partial [Plasmodium gaboni]
MLCGYEKYKKDTTNKRFDKTWCDIPTEDKTPQFLRWLLEWGEQACREKLQLSKDLKTKCNHMFDEYKKSGIGEIENTKCRSIINDYMNWYYKRNPEWNQLSKKYNTFIQENSTGNTKATEKTAQEYIKDKCVNCDCNLNDLNEISKVSDNKEELLKELISISDYDSTGPNSIMKKIVKISKFDRTTVRKTKDFLMDTFQKGLNYSILGTKIGIIGGIFGLDTVVNKIKEITDNINSSISQETKKSSQNIPAQTLIPARKTNPSTGKSLPLQETLSQYVIPTTVISVVGGTVLGLILYK